MSLVFSIVWFVLFNAAGFFTGATLFMVAAVLHLTPQAGDPGAQSFVALYFPGTMWAWVAGLIVSLGYFYLEKGWRLACLWAPIYMPALFSIGVLALYS